MGFKNFIKPTLSKIILFIVLFLSTWLFIPYILHLGMAGEGMPLRFFIYYIPTGLHFASFTNLIIDIIFWYLVSCILILIYKKARG